MHRVELDATPEPNNKHNATKDVRAIYNWSCQYNTKKTMVQTLFYNKSHHMYVIESIYTLCCKYLQK